MPAAADARGAAASASSPPMRPSFAWRPAGHDIRGAPCSGSTRLRRVRGTRRVPCPEAGPVEVVAGRAPEVEPAEVVAEPEPEAEADPAVAGSASEDDPVSGAGLKRPGPAPGSGYCPGKRGGAGPLRTRRAFQPDRPKRMFHVKPSSGARLWRRRHGGAVASRIKAHAAAPDGDGVSCRCRPRSREALFGHLATHPPSTTSDARPVLGAPGIGA